MIQFPDDFVKFGVWWLAIAPKKIFTIFKRILIFINNEFAFSLNIRLLFTPIYGDYTFVGRLIGFVFRVVQIIVGTIFVCVGFVVMLISPFIWWVLPLLITYYLNILVFGAAILAFVLWKKYSAETPEFKVTNAPTSKISLTFTPRAKNFLQTIQKENKLGLIRLFQEQEIKYLLKRAELLDTDFQTKLENAPPINIEKLVQESFDTALASETRYVEPEHVFISSLKLIPKVDLVLSVYGSNVAALEGTAKWICSKREELSKAYFWQPDFEMPKMGGIGRAMTGRVTPELDRISEDLTYKAKYARNPRYVAHKDEMQKIAELLGGSKVNVLIIGEPGSGKSAIMRNMAFQIVRGTGYDSLKFKRIVSLQAGALISGAKTSGDIAQKLRKAMDDVAVSGDVILFIDEIHNLVSGVSNESAEIASVYSILEPYLSSGKIQFVGATNIENYRKYIEPNGSFARLFNIVEIPPSPNQEALEVIKVIAYELEEKHNVFVTYPALQNIITLSSKLIHERVFPDKAIDVLTRAISSAAKNTRVVTAEDVAKEIATLTKIPVATVTQDESEKLLKIEGELKKRVIGQDEAIKQVSSALKRGRVGIRNEDKPIASFLFVGTTGVGKTQTAKALAATYFGDAKRMIRLDMSEYQQLESISRLIGTPDGKSKGILTEAVRTSPFALILLDEIEKAHPNILLTFLQVLDDGRLTESTGKVIDFTNTIIISTSNVGTRSIQEIFEKGGSVQEMKDAATKDVRDKFAPEFLNRYTGIIVFKPLSKENVIQIAQLLLKKVQETTNSKGIKVTFSEKLIQELVNRGYNPQWGARPLARVIEDTVETYIATKILSKELKMGDEVELGLEVLELV